MFGSITLDIVIGLVFVYLLYSLLATIIAELIASWIGLRARMLRQAIERMLNDRYFEDLKRKWYHKVWHSMTIFLLLEFREFKTSMAGRFYQQPSIKYLAKGKTGLMDFMSSTKPSYLRPENFSETLIQMLKRKGAGSTDNEKIRFSLRFNTLQIQSNSLEQIFNLFADSGGDTEKFKQKLNSWYNEMMERLSGWFKRKIQLVLFLVGLVMAITFNIDSISIARKLAKDKTAREQMVQMAISASDSNSAMAKALKQSNDTIVNDSLLKESYRQVKQASDDAGMVLGLGWNLDKLSKVCTVEIPNSRIVTCWNYSGIKPLCGKGPKSWKADSLRMIGLDKCIHGLQAVKPGSPQKATMEKFTGALNYFGDANFTQISRIVPKDARTSIVEGRRNFQTHEKIAFILKHTFCNWLVLLGFIITALAVSLGSNFWFDLLSKLVSMRSAGVKPEEKPAATPKTEPQPATEGVAAETAVAPAVQEQQEPPDDLVSSLARSFSDKLMKIAGVRSVFKGMVSLENEAIPGIRVNVADEITKALVQKLIDDDPGINNDIPVGVFVSGKPQTHAGPVRGQISNKSRLNGTGSIGCVVEQQGTMRRHILSCWHVLKGDLNYDTDDRQATIIDHRENDLAVRWAGGIDQSYDFGFARCLPGTACDNKFLQQNLDIAPFGFRQVTDKDINGQIEIRHYDSINDEVKTGKIYAWCPSVLINYPDKPRYVKDILVLTNDSSGEERTISQSGNSGSLIFDQAGTAIGMIIAGDDMYSYAVKLSNIFNIFTEMKII